MTMRDGLLKAAVVADEHARIVASESARVALKTLADTLRALAAQEQEPDGWVSVPSDILALARDVFDEDTLQDRKYKPSRELALANFIIVLAAAPAERTAAGNGGQTPAKSDSQESPAVERCQPAVPPAVFGPEKQDYPGGPIYRVGTSTGVAAPEQPALPPAQMPLEPYTPGMNDSDKLIAWIDYATAISAHAEALRRENTATGSALLKMGVELGDWQQRAEKAKAELALARAEIDTQLGYRKQDKAELADCKKQLIFANHAANGFADELAALYRVYVAAIMKLESLGVGKAPFAAYDKPGEEKT